MKRTLIAGAAVAAIAFTVILAIALNLPRYKPTGAVWQEGDNTLVGYPVRASHISANQAIHAAVGFLSYTGRHGTSLGVTTSARFGLFTNGYWCQQPLDNGHQCALLFDKLAAWVVTVHGPVQCSSQTGPIGAPLYGGGAGMGESACNMNVVVDARSARPALIFPYEYTNTLARGSECLPTVSPNPAPPTTSAANNPTSHRSPALRLAFVRGNNLYLSDFGKHPVGIASQSDGFGLEQDFQLRFSWSHDGRYLLIAPLITASAPIATIFDSTGRIVRTLQGTALPDYGNGPFWANDSDRLVYSGNIVYATDVASVWGLSIAGSAHLLWPANQKRVTSTTSRSGPSLDVTSDPALNLLSVETGSQRQTMFWDPRRNIGVSVDNDGTSNWHVISCPTSLLRSLPYQSLVEATMSAGYVAGLVRPDNAYVSGHIVIQSVAHRQHTVDAGIGSDPTWSPDGKWLFFVTRSEQRSYDFHIQATRYSGSHGWVGLKTAAYRVSVVRIRPNGTGRQVVTSQTGYDFAQLNVLPGDNRVVFDYIPSDYNLWKHRRDHLTLGLTRRYGPVPRIETAGIGSMPKTLVTGGHLATAQP